MKMVSRRKKNIQVNKACCCQKALDSYRNLFAVLLWLQQGGFIGGRLECSERLYFISVRRILQQKAFSVNKQICQKNVISGKTENQIQKQKVSTLNEI